MSDLTLKEIYHRKYDEIEGIEFTEEELMIIGARATHMATYDGSSGGLFKLNHRALAQAAYNIAATIGYNWSKYIDNAEAFVGTEADS